MIFVAEYRPGDSVRQIHWKLSGRLDSTVIREKRFPVDDAVLILAEPFQKVIKPRRKQKPLWKFLPATASSFMERKSHVRQRHMTEEMDVAYREGSFFAQA